MNATRRICLFCGICMGIITIFLLTCGRNAPARSLGLVNFKPFMASSAFPALPTLSVPFRKQGSKRCHRSLDGSEPGSPDSPLVSGVIPIIFHPHFFTRLLFSSRSCLLNPFPPQVVVRFSSTDILCRTSVDDKPPFQERKEHIMDLGTKVLLISGGFFLFALILGLFGKKMNDD